MHEWIKKVLTKIKDWIMANYATLKAAIASVIKTNGNEEITGEILQNAIIALIESLGAKYQFAGIATPGSSGTDPGTPDYNVMYIAGVGTYPNFGGTDVEKGHIGVFVYNGSWDYQTIETGAYFEYEEYPQGAAVEFTFYDSVNPDGVTIKINKDVSGISNAPDEAISQWWAAQMKWKLQDVQGYTDTFPSLSTSVQSLGLFGIIKTGKVIDSITGVNKLIFIAEDSTEYVVTPSDLPYKALADLVSVKLESGTASNVSIHVRGEMDILISHININEIANHPAAYANAATALGDVPTLYRRKGMKVVYFDDTQQLWIEMINVDDAGANWWTDVTNNWVIEGPIETDVTTPTGGKQLRIGGDKKGNLDDVLNVNVWNEQVTAYASEAAARAAVPANKRKLGAIITYLLDSGWVTEKFISSSISDWNTTTNWDINNDITIKNNIWIHGFINNDGKTITPTPSFPTIGHSVYLLAKPCIINRVRIFGNVTEHIYCWFYDENLDVVGTLTDTTITDGVKVLVLTADNIPSSAKYFRCNLLQADIIKVDGIAYPALFEDLEQYKKIKDGALSLMPYLAYPHSYLKSDGKTMDTFGTGWEYSVTKYLYCGNGTTKIRAIAHSGPVVNLDYLWFYDENLNVVGKLTARSSGLVEIIITSDIIPSNAKYIRFCTSPSILNNGIVGFQNIVVAQKFELTEKERNEQKNAILKSNIFIHNYIWDDGKTIIPSPSLPTVGRSVYLNAVPCAIKNAYVFHNVTTKRYCWFYDENLDVVGYLADTTINDGPKPLILTSENIPNNAKYFRCNLETRYIDDITDIQYPALFDEPIVGSSFPILTPPLIYGRLVNGANSYNRINNDIYPEGFVYADDTKLKIDGGTSVGLALINESAGLSTENHTLTSDKGAKRVVTITKRMKDLSTLQSSKNIILCVGESTTEAITANPYTKSYDGCWGWPSAMQKFNMMDKKDGILAEIITIGRKGNQNAAFTYKNESFVNKSWHEGFSGWPSYAMLNWPCVAKLGSYTTIFSGDTLWYALGLATKTPYNASQYNPDVESYTGSDSQKTLITQTKLGVYKIDGSSSLWERVKYLSGRTEYGGAYPVFEGTGSYTGSAEQISMLQSWFETLMSNPINPFYDIDSARNANKQVAFNLDKYLERYRTCDDNGDTLTGSAGQTVVGPDGNSYTIGTLVTDTNAYKVCAPTHIVINIGINDSEGGNSVTNTVNNIKNFMGLFTIPVAYFITRMPGVCYPGLWANNVLSRYYPGQSSVTVHNAPVLQQVWEWATQQQNKYVLPVYHIQYPASVVNEYLEQFDYPKERVNAVQSNVHPGYWGYVSVGLQVLHWIYNIIN